MERFEPGNKHKIDPVVAAGGRGAQPSRAAWALVWTGVGVCLQEQLWGSGQWLSALKNSHKTSPVPTCSHHHHMCNFGIESCSDGTICPKGAKGAISLGLVALGMSTGRGIWQSLGGNSVGRRVSVLAWKCEMSSNPARSELRGQVALSMVVLHGAN